MTDPRTRPPPRAQLTELLRAHEPELSALFDGAGRLTAELADLLGGDEAEFAAASAHGAGRAREDAGPDQLARDFAALRHALAQRLADAAPDDRLALVELLGRQYDAGVAAYLREREAQLLAMVAHDISNPLMSVCLCRDFLVTLLDGSPEQRSVRDMLQHASQQLQELTRDLQDVADVRLGPTMLARAPVDVGELVREAAARHEDAARERGARIAQALRFERAVVLGDRERLARALAGVLQRLLRTAGAGRVITVRGALEGGEVVLRCGEADSTLGRKRLDTEMFVIRAIVAAHGGRLRFEPSGSGQEQIVVLALPLADRSAG